MSVRKRRLRSGNMVWQLDYRDLRGARRHKQFSTKAEAVAYETTVRSELVGGTHVADTVSITVEAAGDLWLNRCEIEELEASTTRQYRQHLKLHIAPLIGKVRLTKLTKPAIEEFRDTLLTTRSRPLARAILTSLKGILKEARRRGLIGHNAAAETSVNFSRRHKARVEIPTKDELRQLLTKSAELWPLTRVETSRRQEQRIIAVPWRPLIVTSLFTGLRCSELRGLTWSHVDLADRLIRIRQRADFQNKIGPPKSGASIRDVPLSPLVLNTLKEWKLTCPKTALDLVFPSENGAIHSNSNIHKVCWGPLQRKLSIVKNSGDKPRYKFHALRHAAASLFIEQGWSPKKVQVVMGHSSIQVTYDTYGHLWPDAGDDEKAMAMLEARLLTS
jgi:integrase